MPGQRGHRIGRQRQRLIDHGDRVHESRRSTTMAPPSRPLAETADVAVDGTQPTVERLRSMINGRSITSRHRDNGAANVILFLRQQRTRISRSRQRPTRWLCRCDSRHGPVHHSAASQRHVHGSRHLRATTIRRQRPGHWRDSASTRAAAQEPSAAGNAATTWWGNRGSRPAGVGSGVVGIRRRHGRGRHPHTTSLSTKQRRCSTILSIAVSCCA